jgi:hypothetical protein
MSPSTYGAARRSAALRYTDGSAQRTQATAAHLGITDHQTPLQVNKKGGKLPSFQASKAVWSKIYAEAGAEGISRRSG